MSTFNEYQEMAFVEGTAEHDYLMVYVVDMFQSAANDFSFSDVMIVEYQGENYRLDWDDYDCAYYGDINGKPCYVP